MDNTVYCLVGRCLDAPPAWRRERHMQTLGLTKHLVTFVVLGIISGTMLTAPHRGERAAHGDIRFAGAIKDIAAARGNRQEAYASPMIGLRSRSEVQIRDNEKLIRLNVAKMAKAKGAFRTIYQRRIQELERRNSVLKAELRDIRGERNDVLVRNR